MMPNPYHEWNRQQAAERVQKAWEEGKAKDTRKYKEGVAKRATMIAAVNAWMVRLFGGGGGI
jgi:flagellar biosynthesis/type III secretory pathway protein FliH